MESTRPAILLTGPPRIGKTTIIERTIPLLHNNLGGYYSPALTENGQRIAFEVVTLEGKSVLLSTKNLETPFLREAKVGKHRVNLDTIDDEIVPLLIDSLSKSDVIIIDEIGPMEALSPKFCKIVLKILEIDILVIGTLAKDNNAFFNQVRAHQRVQLEAITTNNRDHFPKILAALVESYLSPKQLNEYKCDLSICSKLIRSHNIRK